MAQSEEGIMHYNAIQERKYVILGSIGAFDILI